MQYTYLASTEQTAKQSKHSLSSDLADAIVIPPACDEWDGSVRSGDEWDCSGPSGDEQDGRVWSGDEWDGRVDRLVTNETAVDGLVTSGTVVGLLVTPYSHCGHVQPYTRLGGQVRVIMT